MTGERVGIALRVLSGLFFAGMALCVKALGDGVPLGMTVFFRSAVAVVPLLIFLGLRGEFPSGLRTSRPFGHVARCLMGGTAMFTSFATLRYLPVAEATMLSYLSPVMQVILAVLLLREPASGRRWLGVGLGLAGAAALTLPGLSGGEARLPGIALGLATALLTAGAMIQVRRLSLLGESPGAIALYFAIVSALLGLATLPLGWPRPDAAEVALLCGAGLLGGAAHIAMTLSYRFAGASVLAPFEYLTLIWAALGGLVFFAESPSAGFAMAAPLAIAGAVVASGAGTRARPA